MLLCRHTSVSWQATKLKCWRISTQANLIIIEAHPSVTAMCCRLEQPQKSGSLSRVFAAILYARGWRWKSAPCKIKWRMWALSPALPVCTGATWFRMNGAILLYAAAQHHCVTLQNTQIWFLLAKYTANRPHAEKFGPSVTIFHTFLWQ